MRASNIPSNSSRQVEGQRDLETWRNTEIKPTEFIEANSKTQILNKSRVSIDTQKNKIDGSNKASFSMSIPIPRAWNNYDKDLLKINDERNKITKSSLGKTTGVFLVMNPSEGVILAALKPVKDPEILANKLFKLLNMPMPVFYVEEKSSFSKAIIDSIYKGPPASTPAIEKMLIMEPVSGRAMSEYCARDLKKFLLNERNIELLGKSMVLDIFSGNADRIVPFLVPTRNPGNIMFQDGSVIFIDQAFTTRAGLKKKIFSKLADVINPGPNVPNSKHYAYNEYIVPLVEKSLSKYKPNAMHNGNDSSENNAHFAEFESSINLDEKNKINEILNSGICSAVHLLIKNKDKVLDLFSLDHRRKTDIAETYVSLEKLSTRFKIN